MMQDDRAMPLSAVLPGRSVVLRNIRAGCGLASRLAAMGLVPGVELQVHRNDCTGHVVVALHGGRMALGRGMADKVSVTESHSRLQDGKDGR